MVGKKSNGRVNVHTHVVDVYVYEELQGPGPILCLVEHRT